MIDHKKKKWSLTVLVYLAVLTLITTAVCFSRFSTVAAQSTTVTVAKPLLQYVPLSAELNGEPMTDIADGLHMTGAKAGDVIVFHFNIDNYQDQNINQVLLKYKISVVFDPSTARLPLTYTLEPSGTYTSGGGDWISMGFGEKTTHSYTLTVRWSEADDDLAYTDQQQVIRIVIDAEQEDN